MNLHKMIEICLKDDNMHIFVMINALICINNYVITCINSMLSGTNLFRSWNMYMKVGQLELSDIQCVEKSNVWKNPKWRSKGWWGKYMKIQGLKYYRPWTECWGKIWKGIKELREKGVCIASSPKHRTLIHWFHLPMTFTILAYRNFNLLHSIQYN